MVRGIGGRAAVGAATSNFESKADALLAPLLETVDEDDSSTSSDESSQYSSSTSSSISVKVKQTAFQKIKTAVGELCAGEVHTSYARSFGFSPFDLYCNCTSPALLAIAAGAGASVVSMIIAPATGELSVLSTNTLFRAASISVHLAISLAVFIMAGIAIAHAPYSAYKEHNIIKLPCKYRCKPLGSILRVLLPHLSPLHLTTMPALRSLNNKLRDDANQLADEVDALAEEIDLLRPEATRAAEVEEELREIAAEQHVNVDKLVDLVKENEQIISQMKVSCDDVSSPRIHVAFSRPTSVSSLLMLFMQINLRQRIVQDILKIVMMSDKNNDGRFCKVETKMLVLKISLQLQEYGVEFDEAKFYKVMSADPSVTRTLTIVKRLIPSLDEDDGEDSSTEFDDDDEDEDAYDMFHMTGDASLHASGMGSIGGTDTRRLSLSITQQPSMARRRTSPQTSPRHASSLSSTPEEESPTKAEPPVFEEVPPVQDMTSPRIRKRDRLKALTRKLSGGG